MDKTYYVIDGYNVINHWQSFAKLREENLEHARELLNRQVSEFIAFHGFKGVIVYDAMDVKGVAEEETYGRLKVIYTAENETADTWIERFAYQTAKGGAKVHVVTSDYAEQNSILGSGAYRMSAREFRENYIRTKRLIDEKVAQTGKPLNRNELGGRLQDHILEHFEQLRRK